PRAVAREGRDRADPEPAADRARVPAEHLSGAAYAAPGRRHDEGAGRLVERPAARVPRGGAASGADRRRSADAVAGAARAGAAADESRDGEAEAAADHSDRPARASRPAPTPGAAEDRAAHHGPPPLGAAVARRQRGLRPAPPAGRRRAARRLHALRARRPVPPA